MPDVVSHECNERDILNITRKNCNGFSYSIVVNYSSSGSLDGGEVDRRL